MFLHNAKNFTGLSLSLSIRFLFFFPFLSDVCLRATFPLASTTARNYDNNLFLRVRPSFSSSRSQLEQKWNASPPRGESNCSARPPGGAFLSPVPCSSSNFPRDVVGQQPRYAATRMELLQVKFEAGKSSRWRFLRITSSARSWGTLFYLKLLPSYQVFFAFGAVCDETKRMKRLRCYA